MNSLIFELILAAILASTSTAAMPAVLQLETAFFQDIMNMAASSISKTISSYQFPATGGNCPSVSFNAGHWIDVVRLPNDKLVLSASPGTADSFDLSTDGVTVSGLSGNATWTSMVHVQAKGQVSFSVCFQVCFGQSPYTASTSFRSSIVFHVDPGKVTTVEVTFANLQQEIWELSNISSRCLGNQSDFETSFNDGMQQALESNKMKLLSVIGNPLNFVFANSTREGFVNVSFDATASCIMLRTTSVTAGFPSASMFPLPISKPNVQMVVGTVAKPIALSAVASCAVFAPCGGPIVGATTQFQFSQCGACLQSHGGTVYIGIGANTTISSLTRAKLGNKKAFNKLAVPQRRSIPQKSSYDVIYANQKVLRSVFAAFLKNTAGNSPGNSTRAFFNKKLLSEILATAGGNVSSMIKAVTVPSRSFHALDGAEQYCGVSYGGFSWENVPSSTSIEVSSIAFQEGASSVALTVAMPQLDFIHGFGVFNVSCTVPLPLGAPLRNDASGKYQVAMQSSDAFEAVISINSTGVTVSTFPSVSFNASLLYNEFKSSDGLIFDPYVRNLFIDELDEAIVDQMHKFVKGDLMSACVDRLAEFINSFSGLSSVGASESLNDSLTLSSAHDINVSLGAIVARNGSSPSSDAASLAIIAAQPPFPVQNCVRLPGVCSTKHRFNPPISLTLAMADCKACIAAVNGNVLLGVRFVASTAKDLTRLTSTNYSAILQGVQLRKAKSVQSSLQMLRMNALRYFRDSLSNTKLYLGAGTLSQASVVSSDYVREVIQEYFHAAQQDTPLPFLHQCQISHGALSWQNIPVVTTLVSSVQYRSEVARLCVELVGFPASLNTNVVSFSTSCAFDVDLPMVFQTQQEGTLQLKLSFSAFPVIIEFAVDVDPSTGVLHATAVNMTSYNIAAEYTYASGTYLFDAYLSNYARNTLVSKVATEFADTMHKNAAVDVAEQLTFLLSAFRAPLCNVSTYQGTHIVISTGSDCAAFLPALSCNPDPLTFVYLIDAGVIPSAAVTNHSANETMGQCSTAVPVNISQRIALKDCAVIGRAYNGHVVIDIRGDLPLT